LITVDLYKGQSVVVLGLGRTGITAAKALQAGQANVMAWDDFPKARQKAIDSGIEITDPKDWSWNSIKALILSPGIPHTYPIPHPLVEKAKQAGISIISDMELLALSQPEAHYIGITGTNGKSTTTALVGHVLKQAGKKCQVGGNIGTGVLSLEPLGADGYYVLELSSYQLELTHSINYDIAILLNISADHLERHGGFSGYRAAKRRIFNRLSPDHLAVIGVDDRFSQEIFEELQRSTDTQIMPISGNKKLSEGISVINNRLLGLDFDLPSNMQPFNGQNIAAAYAVAQYVGISSEIFLSALKSFKGLPHRQEYITTIDGVTYINDSKGTNLAATMQALQSYDNIFWIVGGRFKGGDLADLESCLPHIKHVYTIGDSAHVFEEFLQSKVKTTSARTLANAFQHARVSAHDVKNSVVLLSPACESFDQFDNFEQRGNLFRQLTQNLEVA